MRYAQRDPDASFSAYAIPDENDINSRKSSSKESPQELFPDMQEPNHLTPNETESPQEQHIIFNETIPVEPPLQ